jgi:hypothetical protein
MMRTFFMMLCCMFSAASVHAQPLQPCNNSIPASTPDSQLIDNCDGTITDSKTGLMWKKCLEGLSTDDCLTGTAGSFTWQAALQQPGIVNAGGGFAGYNDWRLPNIRELRSIVEERCYNPTINLNRFVNTTSSIVWSGSPYAGSAPSPYAWSVHFDTGHSWFNDARSSNFAVRLVRGGQ